MKPLENGMEYVAKSGCQSSGRVGGLWCEGRMGQAGIRKEGKPCGNAIVQARGLFKVNGGLDKKRT